jgi:hypothetical protein
LLDSLPIPLSKNLFYQISTPLKFSILGMAFDNYQSLYL